MAPKTKGQAAPPHRDIRSFFPEASSPTLGASSSAPPRASSSSAVAGPSQALVVLSTSKASRKRPRREEDDEDYNDDYDDGDDDYEDDDYDDYYVEDDKASGDSHASVQDKRVRLSRGAPPELRGKLRKKKEDLGHVTTSRVGETKPNEELSLASIRTLGPVNSRRRKVSVSSQNVALLTTILGRMDPYSPHIRITMMAIGIQPGLCNMLPHLKWGMTQEAKQSKKSSNRADLQDLLVSTFQENAPPWVDASGLEDPDALISQGFTIGMTHVELPNKSVPLTTSRRLIRSFARFAEDVDPIWKQQADGEEVKLVWQGHVSGFFSGLLDLSTSHGTVMNLRAIMKYSSGLLLRVPSIADLMGYPQLMDDTPPQQLVTRTRSIFGASKDGPGAYVFPIQQPQSAAPSGTPAPPSSASAPPSSASPSNSSLPVVRRYTSMVPGFTSRTTVQRSTLERPGSALRALRRAKLDQASGGAREKDEDSMWYRNSDTGAAGARVSLELEQDGVPDVFRGVQEHISYLVSQPRTETTVPPGDPRCVRLDGGQLVEDAVERMGQRRSLLSWKGRVALLDSQPGPCAGEGEGRSFRLFLLTLVSVLDPDVFSTTSLSDVEEFCKSVLRRDYTDDVARTQAEYLLEASADRKEENVQWMVKAAASGVDVFFSADPRRWNPLTGCKTAVPVGRTPTNQKEAAQRAQAAARGHAETVQLRDQTMSVTSIYHAGFPYRYEPWNGILRAYKFQLLGGILPSSYVGDLGEQARARAEDAPALQAVHAKLAQFEKARSDLSQTDNGNNTITRFPHLIKTAQGGTQNLWIANPADGGEKFSLGGVGVQPVKELPPLPEDGENEDSDEDGDGVREAEGKVKGKKKVRKAKKKRIVAVLEKGSSMWVDLCLTEDGRALFFFRVADEPIKYSSWVIALKHQQTSIGPGKYLFNSDGVPHTYDLSAHHPEIARSLLDHCAKEGAQTMMDIRPSHVTVEEGRVVCWPKGVKRGKEVVDGSGNKITGVGPTSFKNAVDKIVEEDDDQDSDSRATSTAQNKVNEQGGRGLKNVFLVGASPARPREPSPDWESGSEDDYRIDQVKDVEMDLPDATDATDAAATTAAADTAAEDSDAESDEDVNPFTPKNRREACASELAAVSLRIGVLRRMKGLGEVRGVSRWSVKDELELEELEREEEGLLDLLPTRDEEMRLWQEGGEQETDDVAYDHNY